MSMHPASFRSGITESWRTVRIVEAQIQTNTGNTIYSLIPHATGFARVAESLLLVFAVSVLEDSLRGQCQEGAFASRRKELSPLMRASRPHLKWQDFDAIDRIRELRNSIAHRRIFLSEGECRHALNAIARELLVFGVLETDFKGTYSFSIG